MTQPKAMVLCGDGINCDRETIWALNLAGFDAQPLHTTNFLNNPGQLFEAHLLALPGGFSFGDEIASGKVLAIKIKQRVIEALHSFIEKKRIVLGICNGFQVLVQLGLLPFSTPEAPRVVSLLKNNHGKFIDRWVELAVNKSNPSPFFYSLTRIHLPIRHGEGRLFVLEDSFIQDNILKQAALHYCQDINGSWQNIAALTNKEGNVLGLMPHPEAFIRWSQHPAWTDSWEVIDNSNQVLTFQPQKNEGLPDGLVVLRNARKALD